MESAVAFVQLQACEGLELQLALVDELAMVDLSSFDISPNDVLRAAGIGKPLPTVCDHQS